MSISLYDLSVPTFLQTLRAFSGILDRAAAHCESAGRNADELVNARLYPDMAPLHFQVEALKNHSVWGIHTVMTGKFAPPPLAGAKTFGDLIAMVRQAIADLEAVDADLLNAFSGKAQDIQIFRPVDEANATTSSWAARTFPVTSETYLLTYSIPNFYFHTSTAYGILRVQGMPIGKFHYEGELRTRTASV